MLNQVVSKSLTRPELRQLGRFRRYWLARLLAAGMSSGARTDPRPARRNLEGA